jgi:PPOX class probable F420-dependent enzyme
MFPGPNAPVEHTTRSEVRGVVSDILNDVPESHRDLLRKTLTATLTTIDAEGRPRSTAVWYFIDSDGQLKSSTYSDLQQYKDLRRDPNCALLIIDFSYPLRTLEVRATAELTADPDNGTVHKLADKYGLAAARAPARVNCFTVIYRPRRLVTSQDWPKGVLFGEGPDK